MTVIVRAWSNGSPRPSGAGYGLRLSTTDRDRYFHRAWTSVDVELDNDSIARIAVSASFWRTCVELRSAVIGRWLITQELAPWPQGAPPNLELNPLGDHRFRLTTLKKPSN
jgi:hypothetical protein